MGLHHILEEGKSAEVSITCLDERQQHGLYPPQPVGMQLHHEYTDELLCGPRLDISPYDVPEGCPRDTFPVLILLDPLLLPEVR